VEVIYMLFDLSIPEHDLLVEMLTQELDDLASEIHHTDERTYRGELRAKREVIRHLVERLQMQPV
jgi:hypothetical protein